MPNHFFLKLTPNRPTFPADMTPEEAAIMHQHVAFWTTHMQRGKVHVFGPVLDPSGVYGIGVVSAETEEEVREFTAQDPAIVLNRHEIYPMRAVLPPA